MERLVESELDSDALRRDEISISDEEDEEVYDHTRNSMNYAIDRQLWGAHVRLA